MSLRSPGPAATLGFVGLGVMGGRMAKRLLDAGHPVVGYNRTRAKAQWLIDKGMKWSDTPKGVAQSTDIVFSMVTDSAALESIAFQSADVLTAMQRDAHRPLTELRVDGGAAKNDLLMQFQADITGVPVVRPEVTETTALGAAYLAGLATGFWSGLQDISQLWRAERRFEPAMQASQRDELIAHWHKAVERSRRWAA